MPIEQNQPADLVEVTVIVSGHVHCGEQIKKGSKIKVTVAERDWMAKLPTPIIKVGLHHG